MVIHQWGAVWIPAPDYFHSEAYLVGQEGGVTIFRIGQRFIDRSTLLQSEPLLLLALDVGGHLVPTHNVQILRSLADYGGSRYFGWNLVQWKG